MFFINAFVLSPCFNVSFISYKNDVERRINVLSLRIITLQMYKLFLSRAFTVYLPLFIILAQVVIELTVREEYLPGLHSEEGPHELLQWLILIPAILLSAYLIKIAPNKYIRGWGLLALIGSAYVFGEELSWGQHIFEWSTPDYWLHVNDQQETNLHNTSSWLDQKPRLILEIGVIMCGLIIPLIQKFKPSLIPDFSKPILGDVRIIPIAVFFLIVKLTSKITEALGDDVFTRASEVEELYLFIFVVAYLAVLCERFATQKVADTAGIPA